MNSKPPEYGLWVQILTVLIAVGSAIGGAWSYTEHMYVTRDLYQTEVGNLNEKIDAVNKKLDRIYDLLMK